MAKYPVKMELRVDAKGNDELVAVACDDKGAVVKEVSLKKAKAPEGAGPTSDPGNMPTCPETSEVGKGKAAEKGGGKKDEEKKEEEDDSNPSAPDEGGTLGVGSNVEHRGFVRGRGSSGGAMLSERKT